MSGASSVICVAFSDLQKSIILFSILVSIYVRTSIKKIITQKGKTMAEVKQITKNLKITKTNIDEVREVVGKINERLNEVIELVDQVASMEFKIEVDTSDYDITLKDEFSIKVREVK